MKTENTTDDENYNAPLGYSAVVWIALGVVVGIKQAVSPAQTPLTVAISATIILFAFGMGTRVYLKTGRELW